MTPRRSSICLVTPGHLSTNPRLVKEADALSARGYAVSVVSADYLDWARAADAEFATRAWRSVARLRWGPGTPLRRRLPQVLGQRAAASLVRAGLRSQRLIERAWHPLVPSLVAAAAGQRADLYVAHYPAALPAVAAAAARHGARYAFDAEDFHLGDPPPGAAHDAVRAATRAIESRYLPGCAYVTAASPGIADAYVDSYGIRRPEVVLNVFPLSAGVARPTAAGSARPGPSVYWFSQTIGPDRGLECAVRAIGLAASAPHLYLRGRLADGYAEVLTATAGQAGVADRIHVLAPAAPSQMERLAAEYDVGLVAETGATPNRRIALTNKLFSYFLAGIPAIASDIPAHRVIAASAPDAIHLYPVEDPAALAARLDALLEPSGRTLAASRAAAHRVALERFSWDLEQHRLVACVRAALGD